MLEYNDLNIKGLRETLGKTDEAVQYFSTNGSSYDRFIKVKCEGKNDITSKHRVLRGKKRSP